MPSSLVNYEHGMPLRRNSLDECLQVKRCGLAICVRWYQAGTRLSGGEQQMLAVTRLLRDEISEGLTPVIVQALARMITTLKAKGYTIVIVKQNFRFAAPRGPVLRDGHDQIVETFAASELNAKMPVLNELLGV